MRVQSQYATVIMDVTKCYIECNIYQTLATARFSLDSWQHPASEHRPGSANSENIAENIHGNE